MPAAVPAVPTVIAPGELEAIVCAARLRGLDAGAGRGAVSRGRLLEDIDTAAPVTGPEVEAEIARRQFAREVVMLVLDALAILQVDAPLFAADVALDLPIPLSPPGQALLVARPRRGHDGE